MSDETAKIIFQLEKNEDGYPPVSFEQINAERVANGIYRIKNAPFFAENVSYHDLVHAASQTGESPLDFVDLVEASSFTSVSIIILHESMDSYLMDLLRGRECVIEYGEFGAFKMLAVAVPPSVDYQALRTTLLDLEDRELISFAELSLAK